MTNITSTSPESAKSANEDTQGEVARQKSTRQKATENRVAEISSLLSALEDAATESGLSAKIHKETSSDVAQSDNRLVQARLGVANSLFTALRHKHPQSASHSLRVALGCSSWSQYAQLDEETRDTVELAALMHDLGKIGISEAILLKPSRLTPEERAAINRQCEIGLDILSKCCGSERVLEAVRYAGARYDGQNCDLPAQGDGIPLESRMIAIVDAFDSMTTDHVCRPARSRERAIHELFQCAGSQFDPVLVKQFAQMLSECHDALSGENAKKWLSELAVESLALPWQELSESDGANSATANAASARGPRSLFEQKLLDSMHDGVVFVDSQAKIRLWSKGAERLTGVGSGAVVGRTLSPSLLNMCKEGNRRLPDEDCPVAKALLSNTQLRQRLLVKGRQGKHVAIDLHAIPVQTADRTVQGATVLLHDAQPEASLEEKCEALHAEVTKDPMTKVANRAEFDRMQALFIEAHRQAEQPCSLIMVDIDHFKRINDTYGHQAGDEAIISVANLLSSMCRSGDLVARYGGEEFAVLCADCSNADAARRAEQIRKKLSETQFECIENKTITASFGVTELQSGDTPESMLRRSDRALLMAKEQGRNQVVQLGNGMDTKPATKKKKWWRFGKIRSKHEIKSSLTTAVPIDIAIEKLRGFVSDHKAKIVSTTENSVELEVSSETVSFDRRKNDKHVMFRVELKLHEDRVEKSNTMGFATGEYAETRIELKISPKRARVGRKSDLAERARLILQSIKAYLMAREGDEVQAEYMAAIED